MYKNQLQELAQRSCFNLPSYSCIREGPDHAPRFKSTVKFNGEAFESPGFCTTLRQAEHAAAEVALTTLAERGPSRALAARVLDETGVYKNLLQETAHRAGLNLPIYTTVRSGSGHAPVFSCTVELAGMSFTGEQGRTKKQAQKNAAIAAWSSLKRLAQDDSVSSPSVESKGNEEQEQVTIARVLSSLCPSETRSSLQNDSQNTLQRSIPTRRKPQLPSPSLSPVQFQSWPYPSYSPEMAMYQLWQQEQLLQHQIRHNIFYLPVLPSAPPVPPPFPFIQPLIHPDHQRLYFPVINQEPSSTLPRITIAPSPPSLCFSDRLGTEPLRGRSTVTIQEIQDEKSEESEPFVLRKCNTEPISRLSEPVKEDSRWASSGASRSEPVDFRPPNPRGLRPISTAPPVTIRTVRPQNLPTGMRPQNLSPQLPSFSARPLPCGVGFSGVRHSFMAPAVRIRSVVPVCSAPPPRKNPSPSHVRDQNDKSAESSELGKLQI